MQNCQEQPTLNFCNEKGCEYQLPSIRPGRRGAAQLHPAAGYQVIPPPIGATTWTLPNGAVDQNVNGVTYFAYGWDSSPKIRFAPDSPLEGDGFDLSV